MSINLNDFVQGESDVKVFNEGIAGRVKNVKVKVSKRKPEDNQNGPDFNIYYTDPSGGEVKDGIFFPEDSERGNKSGQMTTSRLVSLYHALFPSKKAEKLPTFSNYKEAITFLLKEISSNNSLINVFVTYGTKSKPSQWLGVRTFNFAEPSTVTDEETRLKVRINTDPAKEGYSDNMVRLKETQFDGDNLELTDEESKKSSGIEDW